MDEARAAMEEGRGAELLERKKVEERLEAERQKRIEHTQHMAVHRLAKRELTKGWLGWLTPYLERKRRMRLLQSAGAKLLKPKLVRGFQLWHALAVSRHAKSTMSLEERFKAEVKERELLSVRLSKVSREYDDQRKLDEVALVEARLQTKQALEQLAALTAEVASERKGTTLANAKVAMSAEDAEKARERTKRAEELLKEQQKQAADHLKKQLAETRATLETELNNARSEIRALKEQLAKLEAERMREMVRLANMPSQESPARAASPEDEKAKRNRKGGILGDVDFDEEKPLAPQIKEALQKHAIRVLDLFREWDANGDGQVSKKEFRKAMPLLGIDLPVKAIDELFDQHDPDKSG